MNVGVSILRDNTKQVENIFKKMQNNIEKYKSADNSDKKNIERAFDMDKKNIKDIIETMKIEISSLNNEEKEEEYNNILKGLKAKFDDIDVAFKKVKSENVHLDEIKLEDKKLDLDKANVQQVMEYGDKILDKGDDAITRMLKKIGESKEVAGNIKLNLTKQKEQLEKTQANLKEIDYSLDRANKTIKNMVKAYATDKIILGLIVIIILAIIAIVIVAAVGGDEEGNFNVPHDWFTSKSTPVATSTASASAATSTVAALR